MKKLFLDDMRQPPDETWDVVRTHKEFIEYIDEHGVPDIISFDHDLDGTLTGLDCAKYIVGRCLTIKEFYVHSANPTGARNIRVLLENWRKFNNDQT